MAGHARYTTLMDACVLHSLADVVLIDNTFRVLLISAT